MPKEDLHIKHAIALVVKLEGDSLFLSGDISGAASKYSKALALCPMRSKKERVVLFSNRAQCHLLLQQPLAAIRDVTRTLYLHNPVNRHARSLWRCAQAYDMLRLAKESLLDAILFINEFSQPSDPDLSVRQNKVPDYAERLAKKQMRVAWLFRHGASSVKAMLEIFVARSVMILNGKRLVKVILGMKRRTTWAVMILK